MNEHNAIGMWKVSSKKANKYPTGSEEVTALNEPIDFVDSNSNSSDCASKPFSDCMQCLIVNKCGSDWACILACGISPVACGLGAAAFCIIA